MFIYWHRYFLVAFENMLRAQGAEFACVTLPYFNWVDANSRQMDNKCSSYGDCANITTELGGFTSGTTQEMRINAETFSGVCVNEWPLDHFCQSSTPGTECSGCVPRGDWGSAKLASDTGFSAVYSQVLGKQKDIDGMSGSLEVASHSSVHNSLGAAMGFKASPADPIFWSHHAMVDALHTIFHKCRVGTQRMTFEEKATNPVAWVSCDRQNGGSFQPTDIVTVRTGTDSESVNATQDSVVSQFFEGVPNRFADLMDVRDLEDFSYSYELSGQLASMYTNCDGTATPEANTSAPIPTTSAPTTATPAVTTSAPRPTATNAPEPTTDAPVPTTTTPQATTTPSTPTATSPTSIDLSSLNNLQMEDVRRFFDNLWSNLFPNTTPSFRKLVAENEMGDANTISQQVATPSPSKGVYDDGKVDVIIVDKCGESEQRVMDWYQQTASAMGGLSVETIADLERQSCMYHDQCLGGVKDFPDEFKARWGVKEARCKTIVDAVKCGAQPIVYGQWREDMEAHFGCPVPAEPTTSTPTGKDQTSQTLQQQQ